MDWTIVGYIGIGGACAMWCSIGLSSIAPAIRELTAELGAHRRQRGEHYREYLERENARLQDERERRRASSNVAANTPPENWTL